MHTRFRLEINPSDPRASRIVPDENGVSLICVLYEKLDYNLRRAADYQASAQDTIGEIREEHQKTRPTRRRKNDRGRKSHMGNGNNPRGPA